MNSLFPRRGTSISADDLVAQGIALQKQRRMDEARNFYYAALKQDPQHPEANNGLGTLAVMAGRRTLGVKCLRAAVAADPDNIAYINNLGNALVLAQEVEEGIPYLLRAIAKNPNQYESLCNLGRAYRMRGLVAEGIPYLRKAVALRPKEPSGLLNLAESLVAAGETGEAQALYRTLLATPASGRALLGLATCRKHRKEDNDLETVEDHLARRADQQQAKKMLNYAAGKICLDLKLYSQAFTYFARSKEDSEGASVAKFTETVSRLIGTFDESFFSAKRDYGNPSSAPVFIVGMPRSGTTLTEQIFASHPLAFGAGELPHMAAVIARAFGTVQKDAAAFARSVRDLTPVRTREVADDYLRKLCWNSGSALRVSDKMPHNFQQLGLISTLFPNAKIIHCRRDPIDNCVSIYTQLFNEKHDYGATLGGMGEYYREYDRLMRHWKEVLPAGNMLDVVYEDMIADQETISRRLIDFVGLEWDPVCLEFYKAERGVITPSKLQVRQPIYKSSVKRWKEYEPYIGDLIEALGDMAKTDEVPARA